jgi:RpiB/LacA/LacB family sugar-phosphate isomerase
MRVAVGSDHAGFDLKEILKADLAALGHDVLDLGADNSAVPVDYPDYGAAVGRLVAAGDADLGVCVCGSGIGISIAANKVPGVRAALVHDVTTATLARQHNHANVLCVGARVTGAAVAIDAVHAFLQAIEQHGRHDDRIAKLAQLDQPVRGDRELVHQTRSEGTP